MHALEKRKCHEYSMLPPQEPKKKKKEQNKFQAVVERNNKEW